MGNRRPLEAGPWFDLLAAGEDANSQRLPGQEGAIAARGRPSTGLSNTEARRVKEVVTMLGSTAHQVSKVKIFNPTPP